MGQENPDETDEALAVQTRAGDRNAFSRLVDRYTPMLYSLAYRMIGGSSGPDAAEDAVQEILFRAYRAISSFDAKRRFHTWIYTIALNYLRSVHRKRRLLRAEGIDPEILGDGSTLVEEDFIRREGERLAERALSRLPVKYREVFLLRVVEELSVRESADILGIPENTVKIRLRRARQRLEESMRRFGWE